MATRTAKTTAKKTAAKKPTTRKPPAKKTTTAPTQPATSTTTSLHTPPPVRRRLFTGPMGAHEQAAIRAALAAASLRLPITVRTWNGSQAQLADGLLLIHNPGPDRTFTAHIACPRGAIHGYPINNLNDLKTARAVTRICNERHTEPTQHDGTEYDWDNAIPRHQRPRAIFPVPTPTEATDSKTVLTLPTTPRVLADQLTRTPRTTAADTQPISLHAIADGTATRTADTEQPKEHPEP